MSTRIIDKLEVVNRAKLKRSIIVDLNGKTLLDIVKNLLQHDEFREYRISELGQDYSVSYDQNKKTFHIPNGQDTPRLKRPIATMLSQYLYHVILVDVEVKLSDCPFENILNYLTKPHLNPKEINESFWSQEWIQIAEGFKNSDRYFEDRSYREIITEYGELREKLPFDHYKTQENVKNNHVVYNWVKKYEGLFNLLTRNWRQKKHGQVSVLVRSKKLDQADFDNMNQADKNMDSLFKIESKDHIAWSGQDKPQRFTAFFPGNGESKELGTNENISKTLKDDIGALLDGDPVVIFGFGDSGSGKTYTLMGNQANQDSGVVALALSELVSDPNTPLSKIVLTSVVIEGAAMNLGSYKAHTKTASITMYGKVTELINDKGKDIKDDCPLYMNTGAGANSRLTGTKNFDCIPNFQTIWESSKIKQGENVGASINGYMTDINNQIEGYNKSRLRIRPTPNNPTSSRVHVYMQFDVFFTIIRTGIETPPRHLTIIDMAGKESPPQILLDFNETLDKVLKNATFLLSISDVDFKQNICSPSKHEKEEKRLKKEVTDIQAIESGLQKKLSSISDLLCIRAFDKKTCINNTNFNQAIVTYFTQKNSNNDRKQIENSLSEKSRVTLKPIAYARALSKDSKEWEWEHVLDRLRMPKYGDYGVNGFLFLMMPHLVATFFEGCYINYTLKHLETFFTLKSGKEVANKDDENLSSFDDQDKPNKMTILLGEGVENKIIVSFDRDQSEKKSKSTKHMLKSLDDDEYISEMKFSPTTERFNSKNRTRFIMIAHVRRDRAKGLVETLDIANRISATSIQS